MSTRVCYEPTRAADMVLMNPPSKVPREITSNPPLRKDSPYRWLELVQHIMTSSSRAAVIMPLSACNSRFKSEREVRQRLVETGLIRVVIALPKGHFPQARAPMSLWVIEHKLPAVQDILFVSSNGLTRHSAGRRTLIPAVGKSLGDTISHWLESGKWTGASSALTVRRATSSDVRFQDYDLSPRKYSLAPRNRPTNRQDILSFIQATAKEIKNTVSVLDEHLRPLTNNFSPAVQSVALKGVCEVQAAPSGGILRQEECFEKPPPNAIPIINPKLIRLDGNIGYPELWVPGEWPQGNLHRFRVARGDIVFNRVGFPTRVAQLKRCQEGWIQGRNVIRIRVTKTDVLDPRFLFCYLRQKSLAELLESLTDTTSHPSLNTESVRSIPLLIPPVAVQRECVAAMDTANELKMQFKQVFDAMDQFGDAIIQQAVTRED